MLQRYLPHPSDIYFCSEGSKDNLLLDDKEECLVIVSKSAYECGCNLERYIPDCARVHVRFGTLPCVDEVRNIPAIPGLKHIIGIGGGAVMDVAKACTALVLSDYRYGIDDLIADGNLLDSCQFRRPEIKLRLIPTLFGSSSELTKTCSFWDLDGGQKLTLSHPALYADSVVYDPLLSQPASKKTITISALDCLSHAMETCWNKKHCFITDKFALEAIRLCINALSGNSAGNKFSDLAKAAAFAGLAFAQNGTSLAHALSYPITLQTRVSHGLASSVFLGELLEHMKVCRPEVYSSIAEIFFDAGFESTHGLRGAYRDFYINSGAHELLGQFDIKCIDPQNAARSAELYKKYYATIMTLSEFQVVGFYKALASNPEFNNITDKH
uniref:Iron-containing alcohol dehydrogenase n=1 Tax=Candidatus Kentrum sp. LPFa TaxID=2126335 RepID=A0A450W5G6_9GAMM|nr:MAG: Iron-containing alcohol dehydrogenase [Candidatus Kentron sp. LPFa]